MSDSKKPDQAILTKEQWHAEQFAAHLRGDDIGLEDAPAVSDSRRVTILNPFNLRGVSGPMIDGEAKAETKK
jgi:hypothetical protein